MSSHATAERLSAYLDQELEGQEVEALEGHLDQCRECHHRLQGLRNVVSNLRHLERMAPPSTLDIGVARRIALTGEKPSLMDRFEEGLEVFQRRSTTMVWFCVVFALVLITFFFLSTVMRNQSAHIPVVFDDDSEAVWTTEDGATRIELAGRVLERRQNQVWYEIGVEASDAEPITVYPKNTEAYANLLEQHPELVAVEALSGTVVLSLDGELISILLPNAERPASD